MNNTDLSNNIEEKNEQNLAPSSSSSYSNYHLQPTIQTTTISNNYTNSHTIENHLTLNSSYPLNNTKNNHQVYQGSINPQFIKLNDLNEKEHSHPPSILHSSSTSTTPSHSVHNSTTHLSHSASNSLKPFPTLSPTPSILLSSSSSTQKSSSSKYSLSAFNEEIKAFHRRASQISKNVHVPLGIRKLTELGLLPKPDGISFFTSTSNSNGNSNPNSTTTSTSALHPTTSSLKSFSPSSSKRPSFSPSEDYLIHNGNATKSNTHLQQLQQPPPHQSSFSKSMLIPIKLPKHLVGNFYSTSHLKEDQMASVTSRKKKIYSQLSIVFGIILSSFVIYDYIALLVYEQESFLRRFLLSIQMLHVASFYLFLFGFIYSNESGDIFGLKLSVLALIINLISFVARTFFDTYFYVYLPN